MDELADSVGDGVLAEGDDGAALERRVFRSMFVVVALAVVVSVFLAPWRVTIGLLLGGALSLFNHHWLRSSLGAVFAGATAAQPQGRRPRFQGARYVLRYFVVASAIASAWAFGVVSMPAVIAGLCSFVVAFMVEACWQFYYALFNRKDA